MTSEIPELNSGYVAKCIRCERVIYKNSWCNPSGLLALCITALLLTVPAFSQPLISLHLLGITEETNLLQGAIMMIDTAPIVSFVVLFCAVIAPTLLITSIAISSACLTFNHKPAFLPKLFKITRLLVHWSMLEVYLVSLMVAIFKLMNFADLYIGLGFYFFVALLLLNITIISNYSNHQYWDRYHNL
ncbi:MAG: paraquat-inducible protein A [Alteromonadales bacterium]|nr:paraquat-inducible protein A [Alteromonadales bacterium]